MDFTGRLKEAQHSLNFLGIDGWLLYDFRKMNDLACSFLDIPKQALMTRRFFYWIPKEGSPIKLVHRIESKSLDHLPGEKKVFSAWEELEVTLSALLKGAKKIAMEYSPRNAIPYVSKVDAGTVDLVRSFGVEVVSSADLLQVYTSQWDEEQLQFHLEAAEVLDCAVAKAWNLIATSLQSNIPISEYDVQQFLLEEFERQNCLCEDPPICAVNANSADPHYTPDALNSALIKSNDFILIDLWCKKKAPRAVYADITRVGVAAAQATAKQQQIFEVVRNARDAAMELLSNRFCQNLPIMGWEVDEVCRAKIQAAGFAEFFTHRTGHNIGERDHGDGANIDNFETKDSRLLLPKTCFSIEPGIYLPGEFGIRLEHDVYVEAGGTLKITGGLQKEILCLK